MKYVYRIIFIFCLMGSSIMCISNAVADTAVEALNANRLDEARRLFLQRLPSAETKNHNLNLFRYGGTSCRKL